MLGCLILIHGRFKDLVTFHQEVASARPPGERAHPTERRRRQEREKPVLVPCPLSRLVLLVEFQIRVEIHAHAEIG